MVTTYRLTTTNSAGLFYHVHIFIGDVYLVLPALNFPTLVAPKIFVSAPVHFGVWGVWGLGLDNNLQ